MRKQRPVQQGASASAGRLSRFQSGAFGPAWLRFPFGKIMKTKVAIAAVVVLLLAIIGLSVNLSATRGHDPRDLSYWSQVGATQDWSVAAAQGDPQAQLFHGFALIRTNLVTMIDRVPRLSAIPVIGKQWFESISYGIDSNTSQEQLAEAYRWIKHSADQSFAPAKEAEKLFIGRIGIPNPGNPATNRTNTVPRA